MQTRSFPVTASTCAGAALSFTSIYRTAGWDCRVRISQTDIPDDSELTAAELQAALTTFRDPPTDKGWRLWLLIGSSQGSLFGIMFDDVAPHREGAAGFFDVELGNDPVIEASARNKKLGEVPSAFLRTLVHEAGHALNLFHPKHDIHTVPIGTTIMNQTGDVIGFATTTNPYPCNVTFAFDDHNRTSLIHSPDPQVAPGRKPFGWGHGDLSSGLPAPIDAAGLIRTLMPATGLTLDLQMPDTIFRGEFVSARFVLTNRSAGARRVTTALNLSQGDLRLRVTPPGSNPRDVRDVVIACGDRTVGRSGGGTVDGGRRAGLLHDRGQNVPADRPVLRLGGAGHRRVGFRPERTHRGRRPRTVDRRGARDQPTDDGRRRRAQPRARRFRIQRRDPAKARGACREIRQHDERRCRCLGSGQQSVPSAEEPEDGQGCPQSRTRTRTAGHEYCRKGTHAPRIWSSWRSPLCRRPTRKRRSSSRSAAPSGSGNTRKGRKGGRRTPASPASSGAKRLADLRYALVR